MPRTMLSCEDIILNQTRAKQRREIKKNKETNNKVNEGNAVEQSNRMLEYIG